jgi:hypothetical protein
MGIGDQHQSPYWSSFLIPPKVLGPGVAIKSLAKTTFSLYAYVEHEYMIQNFKEMACIKANQTIGFLVLWQSTNIRHTKIFKRI